MENIGKSLPVILAGIEKKIQRNKGYNRRNLWLRLSHALGKDNHLNEISGNSFKVLFILCTYMNHQRIAFPSLKTISDHTGLHQNTVQNAINELVQKGWVSKERGARQSTGYFGVMRYRILECDLIRSSGDPGYFEKPVTKISKWNQGNQ